MIMLLHSMNQQSKSVDVLAPSWKPQKLKKATIFRAQILKLSSGAAVVGGYDG
jgi:hypothetical protein